MHERTDGVARIIHPVEVDAYDSVSRWLPRTNADKEFWWKFAGKQFASLLKNADYPVGRQYEALIFFYHHICSYAGPAPSKSGPIWATLMSTDGTNMDYSWRWNSKTSTPSIRFIMEPMNRFTGTEVDPLNMNPTHEMLHELSQGRPEVDLTLFNALHNSAYLYDANKQNYLGKGEMPPYTTTCVSFEMYHTGINMKAYWAGKRLRQKGFMSLDLYEKAIAAAVDTGSAFEEAFKFMIESGPALGFKFSPFMVGIDLVKASDTRIKLYTQIPFTRFDKIKTVMTMNGAIAVSEKSFEDLWSLIRGILGLKEDYPVDQEVPNSLEWDPATDKEGTEGYKLLGSFHIYFDIAPSRVRPDIKLYIPTGHYAPNDLVVAEGVTNWMAMHGRGKYVDGYWDGLHTMCDHRKLEDGKGIHSYVAFMIQSDGEIQVTSYFTPEGFHVNRLATKVGVQ